MSPSQLLTELVNAVLAWEEADALRAKLRDSRSSKPTDLRAADAKLVAAIKRLRVVARALRQLIKNPALAKKKKSINWSKIIDTAAKVATAVKDVKDQTSIVPPPGINPAKVIDMPQ